MDALLVAGLYVFILAAFLGLLVKDGALTINLEDDVVGPACAGHAGQPVNPRVVALLEQPVGKGA